MQQTRVQRSARPRRRTEPIASQPTPARPASDTSGATALLRRIDSLVNRG